VAYSVSLAALPWATLLSMKSTKQIKSHSIRRRLLVLAAEILFGITVVVVVFFCAVHQHDPWVPRPAVLAASVWVILGLAIAGQSIRTKRLQRNRLEQENYAASGVRVVAHSAGVGYSRSGLRRNTFE
jgi:hypothetical protein